MIPPQRENSRLIEERKDKNGKLLCLVPICNKLRVKKKNGKRFRNYCDKHGWSDMGEFTSWQSLRETILKRDSYTCKKCGDINKMTNMTSKQKRISNWDDFMKGKKIVYEIVEVPYEISNFVVDHIKPIAILGDEWEKDNLQTLCQKCNKIKTKKDLKEIALYRKQDISQTKL